MKLLFQHLVLLFSLRMQAAGSCSNKYGKISMQLSRAHILRTWQPDGAHCRWWESRQSETNRFPAAVRSGPRWLVMQLRQPLMLEAVSVQDWGGQWQAATSDGSTVSVFRASSLPLEFKLEDPCHANEETFRNSQRWWQRVERGDFSSQALTSFIKLSSESSLSYKALKISGRHPPMKLNITRPSAFLSHSYGLAVKQHYHMNINFFVNYCGQERIACWLLHDAAKNLKANHLSSVRNPDGLVTHKFELKFRRRDHGKLLQCGLQSQPGAVLLEVPLYREIPTKSMRIIDSTAMVRGYPAAIRVTSYSFPEAHHRCYIDTSGRRLSLTLLEVRNSKATDSKNRIMFRVQSKFALNITQSLLHREIVCECLAVSGVRSLMPVRNTISRISEPCQTNLSLGLRRHWLVGDEILFTVTSQRCKFWNVSHSCQLQLTPNKGHSSVIAIQKVRQISEFSCVHKLLVTQDMKMQDWKIQCHVNQSGVIYNDVEVDKATGPAIFGASDEAIVHDLSAKLLHASNYISVNAIVFSKRHSLPVTNVTCEAIAGHSEGGETPIKQVIRLRNDNNNIWIGAVALDEEVAKANRLTIRCKTRQIYMGETVFEKSAETILMSTKGVNTRNKSNRADAMAPIVKSDSTGNVQTSSTVNLLLLTAVLSIQPVLVVVFVLLAARLCFRNRNPSPRSDAGGRNSIPLTATDSSAPTSGSQQSYDYPSINKSEPYENENSASTLAPINEHQQERRPPQPRVPLPQPPNNNEAIYINSS